MDLWNTVGSLRIIMEDNALKYESSTFLKLNCQTINEALEDKAEKELGETKAKRKEHITILRKLIESETNLVACTSEDFLLQFLRAKKFDTLRAFQLLKRYYAHKLNYPTLRSSHPPSHYQDLMKAQMMNFLPLRTPDGCAVWAVRLGLWDPEKCPMEEMVSFGLMCHDHVLKNPITQICGIVSVVDFKGFSWSHLLHTSPTSLSGFVKASQDSFPIRHKAIHIINHPTVFDYLFKIIKPILSPKMRTRIHFHDDDTSLHKFLPVDMLPETFGGTFGIFQNSEFYNSMLNSESEFESQKKFGYTPKR